MTAFAPADLPSAGIDSVERLALWSLTVLDSVASTFTFIEQDGRQTRVIQKSTLRCADDSQRAIIRVALPLASNWEANAAKLWTQVNQITATAIPAGYKT